MWVDINAHLELMSSPPEHVLEAARAVDVNFIATGTHPDQWHWIEGQSPYVAFGLHPHYVGSKKPWNPSGTIRKNFNYYHFYFRKFNSQNFQIDHLWRKQSVFNLIKSIINLNILNIDKPIKYIIEFLRSLKNEN